MARDYVDIGSVPAAEDCEVQGPNYDVRKAKFECNTFIHQLRRMFGDEPEGARLKIKGNPHDFGTYYEVVCYYDDENEVAADYAFQCENEMPEHWDDKAQIELSTFGNPFKHCQ